MAATHVSDLSGTWVAVVVRIRVARVSYGTGVAPGASTMPSCRQRSRLLTSDQLSATTPHSNRKMLMPDQMALTAP